MEFRTQTVARQLVETLVAMFALTEGVWSAAQTQETGRTARSSRAVLLKEGTEIKLKLREKGDRGCPYRPFWTIGLIKHGRNAEFEEATPLVAYVDQDTELRALE